MAPQRRQVSYKFHGEPERFQAPCLSRQSDRGSSRLSVNIVSAMQEPTCYDARRIGFAQHTDFASADRGDVASAAAPGTLSRESLASMRPGQIQCGTDWNDAGRIDVVVSDVVVPLDVIKVDSLGDAGVLIEVTQIGVEMGIVKDAANVALEVAEIDGVEAHERAEEPPVRFDDAAAEKIAPAGEPLLQLIKRCE